MKDSSLSTRGKALATNPARIDFELFMEASQNLYCAKTNPTGAFPLNVAENSLSTSYIKNKLSTIVQQQEIPDWVMNYTHLLGHPEVRAQVAQFMTQFLCKCPISPDTIGFSAGASATIEVTSFVLANPGDVVVIPAPSYPMYTKDLGIKSGIERYDLQSHFHIEELGATAPVNVGLLEKAKQDLTAQGKCFKLLVLTSPDNPTGCQYSIEQLKELAIWCIENKVHLIVNEIYGLSLIDTSHTAIQEEYTKVGTFASFATLMQEFESDYLHLWYAFSKDFAMSGLRFGVVHSLNEAFMQGLANVNIPHLVSNITQWMVGEMLKDTEFVKNYIHENHIRINESYHLVINALKKMEVPYIPSRGSLFVWADFSKYLKEDTDKGQEALWVAIYKNTGVLLTPGIGFQHQKKGLFRIVFTAVPKAALQVALDRLLTYISLSS